MNEPEVKEVKVEEEESTEAQCHTCLSVGREMIPIGERAKIYSIITTGLALSDYTLEETSQLSICWECHVMLLKVDEFRTKVKRAEEIMKFRQLLWSMKK